MLRPYLLPYGGYLQSMAIAIDQVCAGFFCLMTKSLDDFGNFGDLPIDIAACWPSYVSTNLYLSLATIVKYK